MRLINARFAGISLCAWCLAVTTVAAQDCEPSRWGADDEIGAANHISPSSVLGALELVQSGNTHPLGIVIDPDMPAFPPRAMMLQVVQPGQHHGRSLQGDYGWPMTYNDDVSQLWWGMGPQIDGLGHLGEEGMFYNCSRGEDFAAITGLEKFGIHRIPPIVARGVLLDMAEHFGVDALEGDQAFGSGDIIAAADEQGVEFRTGDVILLHTGWTDAMLESDPQAWVATEPGITNEAARYLASLNPVAVGADTWGVEAVPAADGDRVFYGHVTLLKDNGVYILETMNTGRLAAEDVSEFLFVLGQARLQGAVQMLVNPVAIW
ncbi:MAG TPA: cyclase family protein [Gammaproteobacteria bacterium]|nr:cyclase family protein [Gammaproteobacteria bacterium]